MRVLVVGAGPTGLTAAVELARRGVDVAVVDRKDAPSRLSRAVGITPASLGILEPSGVTERLLAEGVRYRAVLFHLGARPVAMVPLAEGSGAFPFILGLPQDRTERHLADVAVAAGTRIAYGRTLEGLSQRAGGVRAVFADGSEERCDLLLGADGVRSTVGAASGLPCEGHDLPETWSIADVEADGWPHREAFCVFRCTAGEVAVVAPLSTTRVRVISNTPDAIATLPVPLAVTRTHRAGTFAISVRQAPRYRDGRVFLAGDAAHCHSPVGGRGMNLGIADAADFARRVSHGEARGYGPERHRQGARTIAASERARRAMTATSAPARAGVAALLHAVGALPPLQARLARVLLHA